MRACCRGATAYIARLQFKRRQSGQWPKARKSSRPRRREGWGAGGGGGGVSHPPGRERGLEGKFDLKIEHFRAVFKVDLTEETRTQLQEEEEIAFSCLILATPMFNATVSEAVGQTPRSTERISS